MCRLQPGGDGVRGGLMVSACLMIVQDMIVQERKWGGHTVSFTDGRCMIFRPLDGYVCEAFGSARRSLREVSKTAYPLASAPFPKLADRTVSRRASTRIADDRMIAVDECTCPGEIERNGR